MFAADTQRMSQKIQLHSDYTSVPTGRQRI